MRKISKAEEEIISYTNSFLRSDKRKVMELCYCAIRDSDKNRIFKESIEIISDNTFDSFFPLVSTVILTANKIECDSLNYIISQQKNCIVKKRHDHLNIIPNNSVGAAEAYIFKLGLFYVLHINAYETGSNTPGGSTDIVRFISNSTTLKPSLIISFGICYGRDPSKQELGDVIIPQKLYPWTIGQKISENKLKIKHDDFNLWLYDKFKESGIYPILSDFCNGKDGKVYHESFNLKDRNQCIECNFTIKTIMGNISTGEAVVSSTQAKNMIRSATHNEHELGGEMEGYGLAKECIYYAKIPCIIIKSICDWGELKNIDEIPEIKHSFDIDNLKDKIQAYSCFCAGIIMFKILNQNTEELITLPLTNYINQSVQGRNFLNGTTYQSEKRIIKVLKDYYSCNLEIARKIFNVFLDTNIIIPSLGDLDGETYQINQKYFQKVDTHYGSN